VTFSEFLSLLQIRRPLMSLPIFKALYSLGLIFLTAVLLYVSVGLAREVYRVWFDDRTYLTDFDYDEGGETRPTRGQALTNRFRAYLMDLDQLFRRQPDGAARLPKGAQVFELDQTLGFASAGSPLASLKLNWQGIDFGGLLETLQKWASSPEILSARISKSGRGTDGVLRWTNAPPLPSSLAERRKEFFSLHNRADEERIVFDLACRVFWLHGTRINSLFARVNPDAFCEWAWLDSELRTIDYRARRTAAGLSNADIDRLIQLRDEAGRVIALDEGFPLPHRLRADAIALLPDSRKTEDDRRTVIADATSFARLTGSQGALNVALQEMLPAHQITDISAVSKELLPARFPKPADLDLLQQTGVLAPGLPLVAEGSAFPSITAGPIVKDEKGAHFVVIPAYAATVARSKVGSQSSTIQFKLVTGETIGSLVPVQPQDLIALVKLVEGARFTNRVTVGAEQFSIDAVVAPEVDEDVFLLRSSFFTQARSKSSDLPQRGKVTVIELDNLAVPTGQGEVTVDDAIEVVPKLTAPGLGGAPLVNKQGKLLGISYAGSDTIDYFLALKSILEKKKLQLARQ
jgi:hypothetical protein